VQHSARGRLVPTPFRGCSPRRWTSICASKPQGSDLFPFSAPRTHALPSQLVPLSSSNFHSSPRATHKGPEWYGAIQGPTNLDLPYSPPAAGLAVRPHARVTVTSARPPQQNGPSRPLPCLQLTPSAHSLPAGRGGHLSHLPKLSSSWLHVAGIAPTRAQVTSPAARAGCRALQGEGAGAPPHPGAGRPHRARAADHRRAAAPGLSLSPQAERWGSPRGAGPFSPSFGRQVAERRPELVALCPVCSSLTRPSGKQAAAVYTLAA
jgi:hypothetical protein